MTIEAARLWPPVVVRWTVPVTALVCVGGAVAAVDTTGPLITTYAATSTRALVLDLAAGVGAISAGAALWLTGRRVPSVLAVLIGCAWSAHDWVGQEAAPPLARSTATVASAYLLALVVHVAITWPGRHTIGRTRTPLAVAYGVTTLVAVGQAMVRRPLFDRYCWRNCSDNTFLIAANVDAAQVLDALRLWSGATVGLLLVAWCAWVLVHSSRPARRWSLPVLGPAALVGAGEGTYALLLLRNPAENPSTQLFSAAFTFRATAIITLALGLMWTAWHDVHTRRAVRRLAHDLARAPGPGTLRDALAHSLGDEGLQVAYWLEEPGCFVDGEGRSCSPEPDIDEAVTTIAREGRTVAVVLHDRSLSAGRDLQNEIGAAARLAVDNERLRAELLFRLADLRASQSRVVVQGDATRRHLERDLHDGAQQRLLGVSYELRQAVTAARSRGDDELAAALAAAGDQAGLALAELRELAHGIFPAILTDAGLGPALQTFAESSDLAVDVQYVPETRCQEDVETGAYVVVVEAVRDAVRRSARWVTVQVDHEGGHLVLDVRDDGGDRDAAHLVHLFDRVGALGGRLHADVSALRAELPCG